MLIKYEYVLKIITNMFMMEDLDLNWVQPLAKEHLIVAGVGGFLGNQPKRVNPFRC